MYEFSDHMEIRLWMVFQLHGIFALVSGLSNMRVVLVPVAYNDFIGSLSYPTTSIMSNIFAIILERGNAIISLASMTSVHVYNHYVSVLHLVTMPSNSSPPHNI